jgi:hypothetical protein
MYEQQSTHSAATWADLTVEHEAPSAKITDRLSEPSKAGRIQPSAGGLRRGWYRRPREPAIRASSTFNRIKMARRVRRGSLATHASVYGLLRKENQDGS